MRVYFALPENNDAAARAKPTSFVVETASVPREGEQVSLPQPEESTLGTYDKTWFARHVIHHPLGSTEDPTPYVYIVLRSTR